MQSKAELSQGALCEPSTFWASMAMSMTAQYLS